MGTRNSFSAPVADHLSRNLNTRCIQRKFVLKGFTNNYLFTKPLITVLMKDDLSSCLVQDNGGDLGAAGWSWGTVAFSLVAPSWEIPSHSWASAEASCSELSCCNDASGFYVSILTLHNRKKQQEPPTRNC